MNKEQEMGEKRVPLNRDGEEKSKDSDGYTGTRCGRIVKLDMVAY